MGSKNVQTKNYISQNDRFADLCNYLLFHGRTVIKAEDLKEKDVTELALPYASKGTLAIEKIRDVLKGCAVKTADGITYLVIGIENQSDIHYAMVVRNMLYDALNYAAQVESVAKRHKKEKDIQGGEFLSGFAKDDTLLPVVTITVYWNSGKWNGPRCLHEMFHVKHREILAFVPDYKMNLIVPDEITDFDKFGTELGTVMEFFRCSNDKEELKSLLTMKQNSRLSMSREAIALINTCVNAGLSVPEKKGEEANMCKAIEGLIEDSKKEIAVRMLNDGMNTAKVVEYLNLSLEIVEHIAAELQKK